MCDWQHVVNHIQKYGKRHKALYLLSPIMAGFLADVAGNGQAFSVLGAMGVLTALLLFKISPRKIDVLRSIN